MNFAETVMTSGEAVAKYYGKSFPGHFFKYEPIGGFNGIPASKPLGGVLTTNDMVIAFPDMMNEHVPIGQADRHGPAFIGDIKKAHPPGEFELLKKNLEGGFVQWVNSMTIIKPIKDSAGFDGKIDGKKAFLSFYWDEGGTQQEAYVPAEQLDTLMRIYKHGERIFRLMKGVQDNPKRLIFVMTCNGVPVAMLEPVYSPQRQQSIDDYIKEQESAQKAKAEGAGSGVAVQTRDGETDGKTVQVDEENDATTKGNPSMDNQVS